MFSIINSCLDHYIKVESIKVELTRMARKLALDTTNTPPVTLVFLDHDPICETEYHGGGNYYGKDNNVVLVWVHNDDLMSVDALMFLCAHECRHAFQSIYDVNFPEVDIKDNEDYREKHDDLPEEVDADRWATAYTGFDGVAWWKRINESA